MSLNPFKVLGIDDNAPLEAAKVAFKSLVKKYHPDVDPSPNAKVKFQEISDAFEKIKGGYKVRKTQDSDWTKKSSYFNDYSSQFNDDQYPQKHFYEKYMNHKKSQNENAFRSKIISVKKYSSITKTTSRRSCSGFRN